MEICDILRCRQHVNTDPTQALRLCRCTMEVWLIWPESLSFFMICYGTAHMFTQLVCGGQVCDGLGGYIPVFMFPGQFHFHANSIFMSSELQLISPSNRQDLQQLTGRESSLALPVTRLAISPLSSINLTVDIASINLVPSRLTLADLIQTAVQSFSRCPEHFH